MLQGIRTVGFVVADLAAARQWYADVLGYGPYFDQPFYVGFDVGGYELGLHPQEGPERAPAVGGDTAYWAVDDVAAAMARLTAAGASPLEPAQEVGGGIVVGAVRDPFGNALGLIYNPHFAPAWTAAAPDDVSERAIHLEVAVPVPPERAWAAWTSSEGLAAWWLKTTRIALRPGGHFELYFLTDAPAGQRGSEGCRVLSYLPNRMLSFTWNAPPHLEKTRHARTWVVLDFAPEGDGGTRVTLTHLGWPESGWRAEGSQWPETFTYFSDAWPRVMARFVEHFGG